MLLYNHKQEFIGLNEEALRLLNYSSFEELLNVCADVADLFANEPGYIHNFKNFGWIDFLLHADSDASSAIVHGNGRTFSCRLNVSPFYLTGEPSQPGYSIEMTNVKSISGEEFKAHAPAPKMPAPDLTPVAVPVAAAAPVVESAPSALPDYTHLTPTQLSEPGVLDIPEIEPSALDTIDDIYPDLTAPLRSDELEEPSIDEELLKSVSATPEVVPAPPVAAATIQKTTLQKSAFTAQEQEYLSHHSVSDAYRYDPNIAANELGLPVDLIEEFIGDFIQQSYDFKEELFEATLKSDFNNLHILSHKLKGVAANLRIEDALETLSIVNTSTDLAEIEANLKYFYIIIAKLEGKDASAVSESAVYEEPISPLTVQQNKTEDISEPVPLSAENIEDIYAFSLKQHDDDSLIVHEHEIYSPEETLADPLYEEKPFEKEFFSLPDDDESPESLYLAPEGISETDEDGYAPLHYDMNSVAGALGIEPAFMNELLLDYKNDARVVSDRIVHAIGSFDTHTWKESAAKLIGISDNLRLSEISDVLAQLSKTNDAQEAKKASNRLIGYLDQL